MNPIAAFIVKVIVVLFIAVVVVVQLCRKEEIEA